jgi:hypothetical protein
VPLQVLVNKNEVTLPNGMTYNTGAQVILDDDTASLLGQDVFSDGTLTNQGEVGTTGDSVTTQGSAVTLTSAQISTTGTGTETTDFTTLATALNKLQADVTALNTALSGPGKALA